MRISVEYHDLNKSIRNFFAEGVASQISSSLITVAIISSYLAIIDAPPHIIGLTIAIPYLTTSVQLLLAKFVEKRNRKKIALTASLISKSSLIAIAITSTLTDNVLIFIILYLIFNIFEDVFTVTWSSWINDLIPSGERGEILSKRFYYGKIFATFILVPQLWFFEKFGEPSFSILFFLSGISGILGVYFLKNVENIRSNRISEARILDPFKNSNFVRFVLVISLFWFTFSAARGFYAVYILKVLFYPLWFMFLLVLASHLSSIYSYRISGIISDRLGNGVLLLISMITFSISTVLLVFSNSDSGALLLTISYIFQGFCISAPTIAFMSATADMSYKKHSAPFYAVGNLMQDFSCATGFILAGFLISNYLTYQSLFILTLIISILLIPFTKLYREFAPPSTTLKLLTVLFEDLKFEKSFAKIKKVKKYKPLWKFY
ncbi:MAG: MFS transporter [Archaeoglobaceae archaeon]|nr:MFS transporter [Archaeoglobaceae archaeon]MCX8151791.1 MFS transporter [Archaeoglobaceae archaeon]MDW8013183.1 MFS transporter [Archaeoglobaceae archaeon]